MAKNIAMKKVEVKPFEDNVVLEVTENNVNNEVVIKPEKKIARKYELIEGIPCRSITSGGLYMSGIKSRIMYEWADNGDVTEVEYQDLIAAVRSNSNYVMKPYFIIEDEEFIAQNPQLNKVYESMYSIKDLRDVLTTLTPATMKKTILSLPDGAKESIKNIASQMISNGTMDSINKIKILDEIFDTKFVLMTELFQ